MAARESGAVNAPKDFEIGVFCGSYVTPVDQSYFDHLEMIRGRSRKSKVEAEARRAVAMGTAGPQQYILAVNGATVNQHGKIVPAEQPTSSSQNSEIDRQRQNSNGDSATVQSRMDISIHNMGDFPSDGQVNQY